MFNGYEVMFTTDPVAEQPNATLEYYCHWDKNDFLNHYYTCGFRGGSEGSIYQLQGESTKSGLLVTVNYYKPFVDSGDFCQKVYYAMGVWAKTK